MSKPTRQERFLLLLDEHRKILHKIASSYGRSPQDREDLVQEMVVQMWRSFDRYDDRFRFSTWMYRVALNVAISFHRSRTVRERHTVPAEDSVLERAEAAPGSDAAASDDLRVLHRLMEQLGELDRALLLLYLDGHRHDAIAEILGISESNVGTRIGRIKQRLRTLARAV